jgi:hypothetical protein
MHLSENEFLELSRENQDKYLELLHREIEYRKSKKILYYEPYDKQEIFHTSPATTRAFFGGNRTGKTTSGGMEFLFHVTGLYPKWYPEKQRLKGRVKGRIAAQDFQKGVGEVIIPFLEEWLDTSLIEKKIRNPIGIPIKWIMKTGNEFDILTYEQTTESFEGWKGHIAWFDEPPPRDKYIATLRGLVDYAGRNWLTLTPLTQPWIFDDIYTKHDGKKICVVVSDITENPYIPPAAIKEFESKLTDEEKEARLHGRFMHLSGIVYKEFNPMYSICEPPYVEKSWTRYFCIDPHERTNTACLWLAVDPEGNHWIYDELWVGDLTIEQVAHMIHAQEGELQPHIRFIDPAMDKDNQLAGGFNVKKELARYGIYCQKANTDKDLGKHRIRKALKPQYVHRYGTEVPQLRVSRTCTQTIYEFQHYIYAERKNKEQYDPSEKTVKKNDHFMDCLRYIYNYGPVHINHAEEEDDGLEWEGTYTKHPKRKSPKGSYYSLVEGK